MNESNYQDALEVSISIIMWGAAVTIFLFAILMYTKTLDLAAKKIDEKQSVTLSIDTDISTTNQQRDTYTEAEVLNNILAIEDPDKTQVYVYTKLDKAAGNPIEISKEYVKKAQEGHEQTISMLIDYLLDLKTNMGVKKYEKIEKYDTKDGEDYLAEVHYIEYDP